MINKILAQPYLLLSLSSLFWSGNAIVGRWLRDYVPAIDINLIRWSIALFILLPFLGKLVVKDRQIIFKYKWFILLLGCLGVATFQIVLYFALQRTPAINSLLLMSLCPILIVITNMLVYREWLGSIGITGIVLSLLGAAVLISHGDLEKIQTLAFSHGDLLVMLACAIWAVYSIALKKKPADLSQNTMLISTIIVGILLMIPLSLTFSDSTTLQPWSWKVLLGLVYLGIFPSILALVCWNQGVAQVGANKAGIFMHLMPVFGAILSILFLGEGLAIYHFTGALLVFSGIMLTTRKKEALNT